MKTKIAIAGAAAITVIAILLLAERQAENNRTQARLIQENETLRQENEGLRQQIAEAPKAVQPQVRPEVDTSELERLRKGHMELLRLRGEVGRLRQELKAASPQAPEGTVLKGSDRLETTETYQPPVEITVVAKTDSTNLRLAYAADQVIFNWELDESQLRVDGGPASGQHRAGAGHIPAEKYVTITWIVTPTAQSLYADGQLRFEHKGDYSQINRPVGVFPAEGSTVTLKSVSVNGSPVALKPINVKRLRVYK